MSNRQQSLFTAAPLELDAKPWDDAAAADVWVARVVVNRPLETLFDYRVPDPLRELLRPGMRVRVPFGAGNQRLVGYCVAAGSLAEMRPVDPGKPFNPARLKLIDEVLDREPLVSEKMLELTRWIADRYLCGWGQVLDTVIPAGVKKLSGTRDILFLQPSEQGRETLANQPVDEIASKKKRKKKKTGQGGTAEEVDSSEESQPLSAVKPVVKLSAKQRVVLGTLVSADRPMRIDELCEDADCGIAVVNWLRGKQLIESIRQRTDAFDVDFGPTARQPDLKMNTEQQSALEAILGELRAARHRTILLRGVTGSGKTEVYIQAIREVVSYGRQAIVLVPEISLTPQTIRRFRCRFESVAVLHSHLSDSERHWHWQRIAAGQVQVVVGARSAVFAPCPHLGLIVIDEEHETSFKQEETPRYHAREVARERARLEGIPLLLGSATPTLESWQRAVGWAGLPVSDEGQQDGQACPSYGSDLLLTLASRVEKLPLPPVSLIDTRNDPHISRGEAIGRALGSQMQIAMNDGGQVILFLNLRGYSPTVWCKSCGGGIKCPHCEITLTFHKDRNRVICHFCEYEAEPLAKCPACGHPGVYYFGIGTQKLEQEVKSKFPGKLCVRMDSDSMKKPGSHDEALERFRSGEVNILLGTQMIAKGLDFPNVTLVGVVNADTQLHSPDLRASERTFQLIAQVAGRTGRSSRGGRVFVQTANPTEPPIALAAQHDYLGFVAHELKHRREANAPPFSSLARIILRGPVEDRVKQEAVAIAKLLRDTAESKLLAVRILGPAPTPITKLRDNFRFHIQLTAAAVELIRELWQTALPQFVRLADVEFQIDVDPVNMR